ncbi:MAG: hypothetical protein C0433_05885 [Cyclobacterium sp.]|nr:hypothetical protein [Cyclobacterium sp.]
MRCRLSASASSWEYKPRFDMSENRNVPKLRFPEFKSVWDLPKLSEKMEIFRGASPRPKSDPLYYGGSIPRVLIEDVSRDGKYTTPKIDYLTEEGAKKSRLLPKGSVILSCSGTRVAIPGILAVDACIHDGWLGFREFIEVENEFLYYLFVKLHERMQGEATTGGVFNNLTTSIIRDLRLGFPSHPEQQKIAEFLTAVDRRIELLQAKKEKLEAYKKGVMQQIFTQKLRFKADDGSDFPDWEEKKLGEVAKFSKGKGISKSDISKDGSQECIRYGELYTEYAEVIDVVISRTELDQSGLVLSQANDVIIPSSGETQLDIARASCVLRSGIALGGDLNIIRSTLNGVFLSFYLNHRRKHQIAKMAQGISVVHLYNSQLQELEIEIPFIDEQNKIAQFLTSLDGSIENLNQQITHTQTWKKGLLQKMFV